MKRLIALTLAMLMVLSVSAAAAEERLRPYYDAVEELLFRTGNVTLTGTAEFTLDGERFKTADGTYIQDGENSYWQLVLHTPRTGREDRENGYTIIANGEDVYVMEIYYPGTYRTGSCMPQSTILRQSVQMNLMADVMRMLADQAETLADGEISFLQDDSGNSRAIIHMDENAPEIVNIAMNLFWQFTAKRYFDADYDRVAGYSMAPMDNYATVTEGVLYATKKIRVKEAEITLKRDAAGDLEQAAGDLELILETADDGERLLGITFRVDVSDRGNSRVQSFDPTAYGVVLQSSMEKQMPEAEELTEERIGEITESAREIWKIAGFKMDDSLEGSVYQWNEKIYTDFWNEAGTERLSSFTDREGTLQELHNVINVWQQVVTDEYHFDGYEDEQTVQEAKEKALQFMEKVNPELRSRIPALLLEWWYEADGELFFEFSEDPLAQDWDGVSIVVRVRPDWRIEYYSCISNG